MTHEEALRLALEALSTSMYPQPRQLNAIAAIKSALEAKDEPVGEVLNERGEVDYISYVPPVGTALYTTPPKQEAKDEPVPVAIVEVFGKDWRLDYMALPVGKHKLYAQQYLYTTLPPQRTWVGLTDEEIQQSHRLKCKEFRHWLDERTFLIACNWAEAKLKEKNT